MPTITVTAPDSAMAMDEVVRQLGSEAYILSTSHQDGLVQIKASLDPLNSSPRRPKAIQTVFEKEMEKHLVVGPSGCGKTTLAAKFASLLSEMMEARIVRLVSMEDTTRPQTGLLPHYAHQLSMPIAHWPISQPNDWGPIARNTIQIIDMACTTDAVIQIWPDLQDSLWRS